MSDSAGRATQTGGEGPPEHGGNMKYMEKADVPSRRAGGHRSAVKKNTRRYMRHVGKRTPPAVRRPGPAEMERLITE